MAIEQIYLKQIGPFDETLIRLPPGTNPSLADSYLLTGPNGSGKSTILYALAELIAPVGKLGKSFASRRLRTPGAMAAFQWGECHRAMAWQTASVIPSPFSGLQLSVSGCKDGVSQYGGGEVKQLTGYSERAGSFSADSARRQRHEFDWAAFAYAGMRSVNDTRVTAIVEPTHNPFENSLSFIHTANSELLAQWIASQDFKRLKAKEAGRTERVAGLERSIRDIERIVSEIIDSEFAFVTSDEDNNVRARLDGTVIELGLLPDGLKSIVSWIADLLMRLDRIPWVDDLPPLQRSFLLLLDEVDVHLHPAWQRKILPIVQRMFPSAQIIASTHSPFVVASAEDAHIVTLQVKHGVASLEAVHPSQSGASYSAVLRSIFGIESEFDVATERAFGDFHTAKQELLSGATTDRTKVQNLAVELARRGEEVRELIAVELRQLDRQLAARGAK